MKGLAECCGANDSGGDQCCCCVPPATSHQPPATSHQPTSHQPPATVVPTTYRGVPDQRALPDNGGGTVGAEMADQQILCGLGEPGRRRGDQE